MFAFSISLAFSSISVPYNYNSKKTKTPSYAISDEVNKIVDNTVETLVGDIIANDNINEAVNIERAAELKNEFSNNLKSKIYKNSINKILISAIPSSDYIFELNDNNGPIGIKVNTLSKLGLTLLSNSAYSNMYRLLSNDQTHLQLIDGIYKVEYEGIDYYYALDANGNVLTGFITTGEQIALMLSDSNGIITTAINKPSIYYFSEDEGPLRGMLWSDPVRNKSVLYSFDTSGKLASLTKLIVNDDDTPVVSGSWELNPETNSWYFYQTTEDGFKNYLRNGFYKINLSDGARYFMFDEYGKMVTGLVKYNGNTYYLQESGKYIGSILSGTALIRGIPYEFDEHGIMVSSMNKRMRITNNRKYAIK